MEALASTPKSWLGEWSEAIEKHGPLVLRSQVPLILDVSRQRVHALIDEGKLTVVHVRESQWVTVESLDAFMADTERKGHSLKLERHWLKRLTQRQKKG